MDLTRFPYVRSLMWRGGRKLYLQARLEGPNDPHRNGEYWLVDRVLESLSGRSGLFLDVGANRGNWSSYVLERGDPRSIQIFAFEVSPAASQYIRHRFEGSPVEVVEAALSDENGEAILYMKEPTAGTNSLYAIESAEGVQVRTQRMDDWVAGSGDDGKGHITMVKSDVEGHDLRVLEGASGLLERGQVEVWQFEYNWRWIYAGSSLLSVFQLLQALPYKLGRLYEGGIELYSVWHPELDRFFETQYVLIREDSPVLQRARTGIMTSSNVVL